MRSKIQQLREKILHIAAQELPALDRAVISQAHSRRPTFLIAPQSFAGMVYGPAVVAGLENVIAAVDDHNTHLDSIHGVERLDSQAFLDKAARYPDALAIDFSCSPRGRAFAHKLCLEAGIEKLSVVPVEGALIENFEQRPTFLLQPRSGIGQMHGPNIVHSSGNVIAAVDDDVAAGPMIHGVPRWSFAQFAEQARRYPRALAIDFSYSPGASGLAHKLCAQAGVERVNAGLVIAQCGLAAVYEPARVYRQRTLLRLDDFLRLADRLDDDFSIFTLYSNLLFRLTYDPGYLMAAWATPANEYFSQFGDGSTFQLGQREHFCDGGAFQGPIVRKFLEASRYQYESIAAFEPDGINYQKLQSQVSSWTPHFRPINKAISNARGMLRFEQTGTMSSHISAAGSISVPTARLDDELEKLTLLKLDIEGFEPKAIEGASRLIQSQRPRMAICVYHYAQDLLDVVEQLDKLAEGYHLRLRQHSCAYYYDLVLYASPVAGTVPPPWAQ